MDPIAVRSRRLGLAAVAVLAAWMIPPGVPQGATGPTEPATGQARFAPVESAPQQATATDIHVFDPYIGRFRSKQFRDEESGETFHYVAAYEWFDPKHSIVKFTISTVNESNQKEAINGQGFYGYDPFEKHLYVLGAFTSGSTGFGSVGEFDLKSHRRVTWARSKNADGTTIHVRDAFEVVDRNTWKNVTSIRQGDDGEWKVVYHDTFVRMEE